MRNTSVEQVITSLKTPLGQRGTEDSLLSLGGQKGVLIFKHLALHAFNFLQSHFVALTRLCDRFSFNSL